MARRPSPSKRVLSIGLKNDFEQVNDLLPSFDWAITEDCYSCQECRKFISFIKAIKAVFQTECADLVYDINQFSSQFVTLGFSPMLKNRDLIAEFEIC